MNQIKKQLSALLGFTVLILFVAAIPVAGGVFARCLCWGLACGWHIAGRFLS